MAAMPIYGNKHLKVSSPDQENFDTESWYKASGTQGLFFSNDDPRMTFYLFMARSKCIPIYLYGENVLKYFQNVLKD